MKKKWVVITASLALIVAGAAATTPLGRLLWDRLVPHPAIVVDSAMRVATVETLAAKLNAHYVFPDKAGQIEAVLRRRRLEGKYDAITDGEQLAKQLTDDIHGVVNDLHMEVEFDPGMVPPDMAAGPPPTSQAEWDQRNSFTMRLFMGVYRRVSSLGVKKVEHLTPRIGYLRIAEFPPPFIVADRYAAAMDQLADTDGLILDLRDNRGGGPDSVALLISYFVDQRTRLNDLWDRTSDTTTQQWTQEKIAGKRYGGSKPIVILAGPHTKSAGEDFAYTMQALKRATVIGKPTWGGAHPTRPYRLGDHFLAWIPSRRSINPITHGNWEGVGVVPDVVAVPDQALAVGRAVLEQRMQGAAAAVR